MTQAEAEDYVPTRVLLERSRSLFEALGDSRGVHLCEIALAREARDPSEALQALLPPIERLVTTGSLTGLDVIAAEALVAARALGAQDLEARVRHLVAATRSWELQVKVLQALWGRMEEFGETGDMGACLNAGWAALDLAVALDNPQAAAVSLVRIATCHEVLGAGENSEAHRKAATLCRVQAARYLLRAARPREAGDLFLEAARRASASSPEPSLLEEALRAYEDAGAHDRAAECRIEIAGSHLESGRPREAIRTLHKALAALEGPETLATEARAWAMLADACRLAGDSEAARTAETRARLLAVGEDGSPP